MDRFILGTANFGMNYGITNSKGTLKLNSISQILDYAQKNGVSYIDTARAYGDAEKNLGKIGINNFKVITKVKGLGGSDKESLVKSIESSIENTQIKNKSFEAILAHDPLELIDQIVFQNE